MFSMRYFKHPAFIISAFVILASISVFLIHSHYSQSTSASSSSNLLESHSRFDVIGSGDQCQACKVLQVRDYCQSLDYEEGYLGLCAGTNPNEVAEEMNETAICCSSARVDISEPDPIDLSALSIVNQTNSTTIYYNATSDTYIAQIRGKIVEENFSHYLNISSVGCTLNYCVQNSTYVGNFNSSSNATNLVLFSFNGTSISYKAADISYIDGSSKQLISSNKNVAASNINNVVVYSGIYGGGIDLQYEATEQGIKEWLTIQALGNLSSPANATDTTFLSSDFKFDISTSNPSSFIASLFNASVPFRTWYSFPLTNSTDSLFLPSPYAIDSANNSIKVQYQIEQKTDGLHIAVITPYSWLANASYPVRIDPGLYAIQNGQGRIKRYEDPVSTGRYNWYGDLQDIGSTTITNNAYQQHGWAWFDVGVIPDSATVSDVRIESNFYDIVDYDCDDEVPLSIGYVSDNYNIDHPTGEEDQKDLFNAIDDFSFYTQTYFTSSESGWRGLRLGDSAKSHVQALIDDNPSYRYILGFVGVDNFGKDCSITIGVNTLLVYYSIPNQTTSWPQCNPSESCCDSTGYFRPWGYVCKGAHNAVCDSSSGCTGHAFENRCLGYSASCPDTEYEITYNEACNEVVCGAQSCSGSTFQPQRTCNAGVCQTNNAFACSNNLNCLDATSCKKQPFSTADCASGFVFDSTDNVCWAQEGTSSSLTYDANGNLVNGQGLSYGYDSLNQLVNVSQDGSLVARYFYDDKGTRIKKVEPGENGDATTYYFDDFVQIINASGTYNETYYYYYDKLAGKKDQTGTVLYYHSDAVGSTSLITTGAGAKKEVLNYDPYGSLVPDSSSSTERYTFTGQEHDSGTDLLYMGARYQNPDIAQFIQPDSILQDTYNPQDLNKYAYARNNPYKYVDSSGHYIETAIDVAFIGYDIHELRQDSRSITNWVALGGDIVGAALPFATGVGEGIRIASKIGKIDDATNAAKIAKQGIEYEQKGVKFLEQTGNEVEAINKKFPIQGVKNKGEIDALLKNGDIVEFKSGKSQSNILSKATQQYPKYKYYQFQSGKGSSVYLYAKDLSSKTKSALEKIGYIVRNLK